MKIDIFKVNDCWQEVKDAAMNTIGKTKGVYPDDVWKKKILMSEHSPIRRYKVYWRWNAIKYWISVHFVRHKIGIEHWVSTQRTDRTGVDRDDLGQGSPVNHACEADAQSLINISRRRLCNCSAKETQDAWRMVREKVREVDPIMASAMVRECVYRNGLCPEMFTCEFNKTDAFKKELKDYLEGIEDQVASCNE